MALRRRLAVVKRPYLLYDLLLNITVNQSQLLHCVPYQRHVTELTLLMDRKVPKYFINIMLSWFEKGCAYVFTISAGVRQGGLLSPLLFAVYMDVLINRLQNAGIGCKLAQRFLGVCYMLTIFCCWRIHWMQYFKYEEYVMNLQQTLI